MTPNQLADAAAAVVRRYPHATLKKNAVGNLAILLDDEFVGFINLRTGEVDWMSSGTPRDRVLDDVDHLVGELLALRREDGKNQADLAKALQISQSTISRIEDGRTDPPLRILAAYAAQCGKRLTWKIESDDPA